RASVAKAFRRHLRNRGEHFVAELLRRRAQRLACSIKVEARNTAGRVDLDSIDEVLCNRATRFQGVLAPGVSFDVVELLERDFERNPLIGYAIDRAARRNEIDPGLYPDMLETHRDDAPSGNNARCRYA